MRRVTLTAFVLARIAEDEDAARVAIQSVMRGHQVWDKVHPDVVPLVAARSPRRIIDECESKRRLVVYAELHPGKVSDSPQHTGRYVLQLLALPYSGHSDFNETWRP